MTIFDYIILAITIGSTLFGLWRGVVREILGLLAWFIGIYLGINYGEVVGTMLEIQNPLTRSLTGGTLIFFATLIVMAFLKIAFNSIINSLELNTSDKILGGVFGFLRGLIIASAIVITLGFTSCPETNWWKDAYLSATMEKIAKSLFIHTMPEDVQEHLNF